MTTASEVATVAVVDAGAARVHAEGWQSWSPTTAYRLDQTQHHPTDANRAVMGFRPDSPLPEEGWQGEGLLVVDAGDGTITLVAGVDLTETVPSIRALHRDGRVVVTADGPVAVTSSSGGIPAALAGWADEHARAVAAPVPRAAPSMWCSWYQYFTGVAESDMDENLAAMDRLDLAVDVVQLDDGYQSEIGDWLTLSGRFASLTDLAARVRDAGRRVGIWTAPLLVSAGSQVAAEHPDWLVQGAHAGHHWDHDQHVLDITHPEAAAWLTEVFTTFRGMGFDLFKIDFMYSGAIPGGRHGDASPIAAYREALRLVRAAVGEESVVLGCGAPLLPSVGLVDAMRISPDTGPNTEPRHGDMTQPSVRAAILTGEARTYQHGRFWVSDPDCLLARPEAEDRQMWGAHVLDYARAGGLRASSDRLELLDETGLATTRAVLAPAAVTPLVAAS